MDVHISVIEDFKHTCPEVNVVDWCMSGHAHIMHRGQDVPSHINSQTWRHLNPDMIAAFQAQYDPFLKTFDFFIVGYASGFAMVYEKYNKPILMLNAVRCDIPFCWTKNATMLQLYKDCINRLHAKKLLTIVSNSKAEQMYTTASLGIVPEHVPSLCLYTNIKYTPSRDTFLCYNGSVEPHPLVTHRSSLGNAFPWSVLGEFKGIIHFPYEPNTMSIFEHFSGGLPMFFPSKSYWNANPNIQSISKYWGDELPSTLRPFRDASFWIENSDIYTTFASPNTYYFDSIPHLFTLLQSFVYVDDREFRERHIQSVREKWHAIVVQLFSH